ncbi:eukaryotic translation initiation factor 6 protein [Rutstroemia sp. NJR-2017a BVV2]|nr:eukaryotic translation initiation factor 6 protein [Rutstroemia sp. NJR-2017a BVV2]
MSSVVASRGLVLDTSLLFETFTEVARRTRNTGPSRGGGPPAAARRSRPRLVSSDRYMERQRALTESNPISSNSADLHNGPRYLEAATSSLRALLDTPILNTASPTLTPQEPSAEAEHNRRIKRRKLDPESKEKYWGGFNYGRYGQVEPGTLQMEIVSCDGGIFQDPHYFPKGHYAAENVLREDNTVYCTKSNRCNMVFKHQGETAFSLTELIIKAPHKGFTAPVQEGMVFISGTSNDLLTRTAQYQIQYSSAPRNPAPPIISIRHNADGSMTTAQARASRLVALGMQDAECDIRTAQIPSDFANITSPFQVTMECSSDFSDNEESTPRARTHRPTHSRVTRNRDTDSDDEDATDRVSAWDEDYLIRTSPPFRSRLRRRETASNITLAEAAEASQIATQEAVRAVGGELMVPHARFFIERDKSKCTIKFSTPISGKYILLKLWSPDGSSDGNIDIQSVVAKGFAGPRFFPKVVMR